MRISYQVCGGGYAFSTQNYEIPEKKIYSGLLAQFHSRMGYIKTPFNF